MLNSQLNLVLAAAVLFTGATFTWSQANPASVKEQEAKLIALLKSEATQKEKADACRQLAQIGTRDAVAPLAALLSDEKLSHMARYGLEPIPDPAVDVALREALGKVKGRLLAGVIGSLGVRHDAKAVEPLTKFLTDPDADVAQAAARALGKIGTPEAGQALQSAVTKVSPANQLAFCEGALRCAENMAAKGQKKEALAIYDQLRGLSGPQQVRVGALRGAILVRGQDGLPLLAEAIRGNEYLLVAAAARTAMEMPGAGTTKLLVGELGKGPADRQILLIQTLGKLGDPASVSALSAAAKTGEKNVRLAAIRALPEIGNGPAVPVLVELQGDSDREIAQAAQESLAGFPGPEADAAVAAMLNSTDTNKRLAGIDLIGRRRMMAYVPALLKAASDQDPKVRPAALKRIGELASRSDLPALLDLLVKAPTNQDLDAAQQAVTAVCTRANDPAGCTDKLVERLPQASPAAKGALLRALSAVGGPKALKVVSAAVNDSNTEVHAAALRALGSWQTADAAPELLALAQKATNPTDKLLCLRSYLGLVDNPEFSVDQRVSMCRQVSGLAQTAEEKKLLLAAIGSVYSPESLNLLLPYLDDATVKDAASAAVVGVSGMLLQQKNAATFAAKLVPALEKVVAVSGNADVSKRASTLLQQAKNKK